jgi:hypothetical protein
MALKRRPPANNIRRAKTNGSNTWGSTTNQQNETVQFESGLAKELLVMLLRKPGVVRVVSEPVVITFLDTNGKKRTYTPDYKVIYDDGKIEIHEFSMSHARLRSEIQERELGAVKHFGDMGWAYIVHTEYDLPSPTEYANLRAIRKFAPKVYDDPVVSRTVNAILILNAGRKVSICELASQVCATLNVPKSWVYSIIWHSIWHNKLAYNPDVLLILDGTPNPDAVIWIAQIDDTQ